MKKSVITLLIFLIMIISVSAVSAADDAADLGASDDTAVSVANTDMAVTADGNVKNFTDLSTDIAGSTSGDANLGSDYVRNESESGVTITVDKYIYGHGSTIDANGTGTIFTIDSGAKVTLLNVILKNAAENAIIVKDGTLTLQGVTFVNCTSAANSAVSVESGDLTVTNCNFENRGISFSGNELALSGNTFSDNKAAFATINAGTLTTESTIDTDGALNEGNWQEIDYTAIAKDDNGNLIAINDGWTVTIGDGAPIVGPVATAGFVNATAAAEKFGTQLITATNAHLTTPVCVAGNVTVKPSKQTATDIVYSFTKGPNGLVWNDSFNITAKIDPLVSLGGEDYNATGTFTITVNTKEGKTVEINSTTGEATFVFNNIEINNYNIVIKYNGDDVYPEATKQIPVFEVTGKPIEPEITVTQTEKGKQVITLVYPTDAVGTVTASVDGYSEFNITSAELADGKVSMDTKLQFGDYYITYEFVPDIVDKHYAKTSGSKQFTVPKLDTTVIINAVNGTYSTKDVAFAVTFADGVAKASWILKDENGIEIKSGNVTFNKTGSFIKLGKVGAGKYTINVTVTDDNYTDATNETAFEIAKATPTTITMVVGEPIILFNDVAVNVTAKFAGNVVLYVNGIPATDAPSNKTGVTKLTIDSSYIETGENTIVAIFEPTDSANYTSVNTTQTFTVDKVTPAINVTVDRVNIGQNADIIIKVQDLGIVPTGYVSVKFGTYDSGLVGIDSTGEAFVFVPASYITEVKEYTVDVVYNPNTDVNYNANSTVFKFNVTYWDVEFADIAITNVTAGNNITIPITATGANGAFKNNFTIVIKNEEGITINTTSIALENGVPTSMNFTLPMGVYTAVISYPGDDIYAKNSTTTEAFSVYGIIENLTIEIENATYPANATAIVKSSVDGKYNVTVEGKDYTVTVSEGIGSVTLDVLAANPYTATVKSIMDEYKEATNTTTFTIKKGTVKGATLTIETVTYPENATAIVKADVDGTYYIRSESGIADPGYVDVVNGTGNVTFAVDAGAYTFTLVTFDNQNYTSIDADTKQLIVNKGTIDVNLTVEDVLYNDTAKAVINVTVGGSYTISLINATGGVIGSVAYTFNDGEARTFTAPVLIPGTYTVKVTATINNYNPVDINKTFEVKTGIVYYSVVVEDYTYGQSREGTLITTVPGTNGKGYVIYLDDVNIANVTGADANKTFDVSGLATGTYTVKVVPIADDPEFTYYNLGSDSNSTTFTVKPAEATFGVEADMYVIYPNNVTINITGSSIDGNYTVTIGDITKEVAVTQGVTASVDFENLPIGGSYIAYVNSINSNYTAPTQTVSFAIVAGPLTPTIENVESYYYSSAVVNLKSNADGKYIITVNGKDYTIDVKDGKGNVSIDKDLAVGEYPIKLFANITDYMIYSNDTIAKLTVKKANVGLSVKVDNVTYPENATATVSANATGIYSIVISNGTTVAKYNVTITTTPGEMKSASVDIGVLRPALAGTGYVATVDAIEYDSYNLTVVENTTNIVVNKATPVIIIKVLDTYSIYDDIVINITVADADAPDEVEIKCDLLDAPVYVVFNNGFANYTIPKEKVTKFATHVITAEVIGGDFVSGVYNQTAFEVTKIDPKFNITYNNAAFKEDAIVNVTFANLKDGVSPTGTLTIVNFGSVIVNGNDNYTFNLGSNLTAGVYTLNISYTGDGNYSGISELYNITIEKITPVVTVINVNNATYPDNATVSFNSTVAGNFTIDIIDSEGNVVKTIDVGAVANNTVMTVSISKLNAGKYTANVTYVENENYNSATNSSDVFEILKATNVIQAVIANVEYPNAAVAIVDSEQAGNYRLVVTKGGLIHYDTNGSLVAGANSVELAQLPAGEYVFTVIYESDNYDADAVSGKFTVVKGIPTITIDVADATFPETGAVNISCDADGEYNVTISGILVAQGSFTAGEIIPIEVPSLAAGVHAVYVDYAGNENYNATTEFDIFNIAKATPTIYLVVNNTDEVGEPSTLYVYIPYATGTVKVNGVDDLELDSYGVAKFDIGILKPGDYNFTANYYGNENLTAGDNYTSFSVDKLPAHLVVTVENTTYGTDPEYIITLDNTDPLEVKLSVDGSTEQVVKITNGTRIGHIANLHAGDHTVTVVYDGSEIYSADTKTVAFNIAKADVTVTIVASDVAYPGDVVVTVMSDVAGQYSLFRDADAHQYVTLEANVAKNVSFSGLNAGNHEFTIVYLGSEDYNYAFGSDNATVTKGDVNMAIIALNVTYPDHVVVTVSSDVAGNYSLFLGTSSPQYITLRANKMVDVDFGALPAGTYEFTLTYLGSENYNAGTVSTTAIVSKDENTTMNIEATSPIAGENATITVTLPADATGTVEVKYGNGVYTVPVENGVAVISVPTNVAGTETATVKYSGDDNYAPASSEVSITVKEQNKIIADNIKRGVNSPYDYYATLVDGDGNPISGVEITFTIEGQTYTAITNASGIATVSAGLALVNDTDTVYNVIVTNPYTLENTTATTTIVPRLIVVSGDLSADYLENPPYIVQAIGDDGTPVGEGETVKVVFAGFYYDLVTNATGHVERTIGLAPGQYAVKACYQGYNTTATVFTVKQIMKVTSGTLKKTAKSYTLKATLKSSNGKAIVGKEVKLTFNGKTYTATTNSKGVASVTIKSSVISKLTAGKTYTLKAKYVNDVRKGKIKVISK